MPLPDDLSAFRYGVHPDVLRKRYNVSDNVATNANNSQVVFATRYICYELKLVDHIIADYPAC